MNKIATPTQVRIEASSHCQLRCPSCPTTQRTIDPVIGKGFMRAELFRKFLENNPTVKHVELSNYGEAFLNPQISEILEAAYTLGVSLTILNGANLNTIRPRILEDIVKYRLKAMTCSIDGVTNDVYQIYRVNGHLPTVLENIKQINRWKEIYQTSFPKLTWQFIIFGHNEHQIEAARALAESLQMDFVPKLNWDAEFSPIINKTAVEKAAGIASTSREEYAEKTGRDYMQHICNQLWRLPQINWDGELLGCCVNYWGRFGGNVFKESLETVVNGEQITAARDMLTGRGSSSVRTPCASCKVYKRMARSGNWLDHGGRVSGTL